MPFSGSWRTWTNDNTKGRTKGNETSAQGTIAEGGDPPLFFCVCDWSTHVCPFCNSANLDPTESTQPWAASPRFARPRPIAPSGFIPEIDTDVDDTPPTLARFPKLELSPVSDLSASARGTRESRECRRTVLLDGDGGCPGDVGERCCGRCATRARLVPRGADACLASSLRETTSPSDGASTFSRSGFSSATDDMDD